MRLRPSARLLVLDAERRLLLFKFIPKAGASAGTGFWATPGGGLDPGETFERAAVRELFEETGSRIDHPGPKMGQRKAVFRSPQGEIIKADERYFLIRVERPTLSSAGWTEDEREMMTQYRWWTFREIEETDEQIWPETLLEMLGGAWA